MVHLDPSNFSQAGSHQDEQLLNNLLHQFMSHVPWLDDDPSITFAPGCISLSSASWVKWKIKQTNVSCKNQPSNEGMSGPTIYSSQNQSDAAFSNQLTLSSHCICLTGRLWPVTIWFTRKVKPLSHPLPKSTIRLFPLQLGRKVHPFKQKATCQTFIFSEWRGKKRTHPWTSLVNSCWSNFTLHVSMSKQMVND